jgi:23S rRNA pseudouridine1911/1915/1917 synthase
MAAPDVPDGFDEDGPEATSGGAVLEAVLIEGSAARLDRALADALPELSRARLRALMEAGAVTRNGEVVRDASGRAVPGTYRVEVPPPAAAIPEPQDLPLDILFEDADLIVVNKAAGIAVHPGPGVPDGTLVNALLHHCAASLSGIGGVARPGIVHRLDKETSGVMVAAKTDAAHQGLAALFAAHDIERSYIALVRGAPRPPAGEIRTRIGRSTHDRMKMAVLKTGGREAVTHYRTERTFGPSGAPLAARLACRLETGRTHQIRVHMASLGSPCLGDPVYGSGAPAAVVREALRESGLARQALHAAVLGFVHPVTGEGLRFESTPPPDMAALEARLSDL